jgi:hypothetical protein
MKKYNPVNKFMYWLLRWYERRVFFAYYKYHGYSSDNVLHVYFNIDITKNGLLSCWTPEKNIKRIINLIPEWDKASTCNKYQIPFLRRILLSYFRNFK